ncbi:MAG: M20/M25/M40 family metallo-hydrolase [Phycisphaeraceae bacterium]|nr:M20/M25/M40 family metallo-hydrolase [Phycisphaeraceae bacterium]
MSQSVQQIVERQSREAEQRLMQWLRIPSVSADPARADDMAAAAQWACDHLKQSGLDAKLMPTGGPPVVYAQVKGAADKPTVLFYGHYDVQPPEPLELWQSPPFEPQVREGIVYARGAVDDKGQVLSFLEALRAWHMAGEMPFNVKILLEGEEEVGSAHLTSFIEKHRDLLAADFCLVSDSAMWVTPQGPKPTITYALRGMVYFDVQLHGPKRDLHSGVFGGTLANPATMLTRVIGKLFDDNNRITIPGFYDDVPPPEDDELARWNDLGFDESRWFDEIGAEPFGEAGFSTPARMWTRPACDVNGLYGGYMQRGAKTIIPSFAGCKVSFRIPAHMDPRKVSKQFTDWLHTHDVGGCTWKLENHGEAWPCTVPIDSPWMKLTNHVVEAITGEPVLLARCGATIPIAADMQRILGTPVIMLGFGLDTDLAHSPNEHFALDRFHLGIRIHAQLLGEIGSRE